MTPASQRLEPGHLAGGDRDLWLVIEDNVPPRDRLSQVGLQHHTIRVIRVVLGTVHRGAVAGTLRHVQRDIGALEQRLGG